MEINRIYPEYYQMLKTQRGSPAFKGVTGNILNSSPQNLDSGVNTDLFEAKKAVEKINRLDKKVQINPYAQNTMIPVSDFAPAKAKKTLIMDRLKSHNGKVALNVLGILPPIRRDISVIDKLERGNSLGAGLQVAMGLANLPSDVTQLGLGVRETKKIFKDGIKNVPKNLPKKEYQRAFRFFKGTFMEGFAKKYKWLDNWDKTLFRTKFGEKIKEFLGIKIDKKTGCRAIKGLFSNSESIPALKINGNSLQKIAGNALLRISKISLFTTVALEIPALIKSVTQTEGSIFDKAKAFGKQLTKSCTFVGLITAGIAIGGAILFPYGIAAEIAGMALGSALALSASRSVNKKIDNIFMS